MTISGTSTIFQYFKFTTATSGELTQITEKIPTAATKNEIVKVGINFTATSESGNTTKGYGMAPFSDAVVLRLQPTEVGSKKWPTNHARETSRSPLSRTRRPLGIGPVKTAGSR